MRSAVLLVLVLVLAPPAPAQAPIPTPAQAAAAMRARGDFTIRLTEDLRVPASDPPDRQWQALQTAIDACRPEHHGGVQHACEVRLGIGDRQVNWAVLNDCNQITITGEGDKRSALRAVHPYYGHVVIQGFPRIPYGGGPLDLERAYPPAHALDASAAGRRAVRLDRGRIISLQGSPLDKPEGDWWGGKRQVTVEFILDAHGRDPSPGTYFPRCGMQEGSRGKPWLVMQAPGELLFRFTTDDGRQRQFRVAFQPRLGPRRVILQLDCVAGTVWGAVDGVSAKITERWNLDGLAGRWMAPNEVSPFLVGGLGSKGNACPPYAEDFTFDVPTDIWYGVRVSTGVRYHVDPEGSPVRRLDGRPVNDANLCFEGDALTLGYLDVRGDPAVWGPWRLLQVSHQGGARSAALLVEQTHQNPGGNTGRQDYSDLAIRANIYGYSVWNGFGLYSRWHRVILEGGGVGFGSGRFGSTYDQTFVECGFGGRESAWAGYMITADMLYPKFWHLGRRTVVADVSDVTLTGARFMPSGTPEMIVDSRDNTKFVLDGGWVDIESGDYPSVCYFRASAGGHYGKAGQLTIRDFTFGHIPDEGRRPVVVLAEPGPGNSAEFRLEGPTFMGPVKVLATTEGPRWKGLAESMQGGAIVYTGPGADPGGVIMVPGPTKETEGPKGPGKPRPADR